MRLLSSHLAIDLGTVNTLLYAQDRGIVVNEPSVVAIGLDEDLNERVLAVGSEAKRMMGKTPDHIQVIRPLRHGSIANIEAACVMLKHFIAKAGGVRKFNRLQTVIAVPAGLTQIEMGAVRESVESAGAHRVILIEGTVAAALGAGLPVSEPACSMVVDVGGGKTEVAIISLAEIVASRSSKVAGDLMDTAIQTFIKRNYNLLIGDTSAELIKTAIGNAYPDPGNVNSLDVKGRDLESGVPKMLRFDSEEIRAAITEQVEAIVGTVRAALEEIPPELSADVIDRGILLTGGGALLKNLDKRLGQEIGLPMTVPKDPLSTVVTGAYRLLENMNGLAHFVLQ
ncbi:MAG: rod shape-determining protein [Desulfobacterales bacterium]|jgi:rod shape-determining protein MreB